MLRLLVLSSLLAANLALVSCGDEGFPEPRAMPPAAPDSANTDYLIRGLREWAIIGNEVDEGNDTLDIEVVTPSGTKYIDVWVGDGPGQRLTKAQGGFLTSIDISDLPPGEYQVLMAADGDDTAFVAHTFKRSHPLYVTVGTDWDDADTSDAALALQDDLHAEHPELLLTHFVGPYTFTDPSVDPERQVILEDWLIGMRDDFGDEIGVHIHPYCNFVEQVGSILGTEDILCNTEDSTVYGSDSSGYTIIVASYSEEDFTKMLLATDAIFADHGLGKPTSFRAGGWTSEIHTLHAVEAAGYTVDSDALNWARMEEWDGPRMGIFYEWSREHWSTIDDTSQPYYPAVDDILETGPDTLDVLQIPLNGIMVDYATTAEMIEIFDKNWDGGVLEQPTSYAIGYHPSNFNTLYKESMTDALSHVDQFLASQDKGPAIYARMNDMPKVWKQD